MSHAPTQRTRSRAVAFLVVWFLVFCLVPAVPSQAAQAGPQVVVSIDTFSPRELIPGEPVTITGTVRNDNDFTWTTTQAYASIASRPAADRPALVELIDAGTGFSGSRIVDLETIGTIGDLDPGETAPFSITVPWAALDISAATGVRTVGIQVLGTAPDGTRSTSPIGTAATVVPIARPAPATAVPGALVLTLAMPTDLTVDGTLADPAALVAAVAPSGPLRRVLDLARSLPVGSVGLAVDPQLIEALTAVAGGPDEESEATADNAEDIGPADLEQLATFRTELLAAMTATPTLIVGYGVPDVTALTTTTGGSTLAEVVAGVTADVIEDQQLTGTTVTWVPRLGLSTEVVRRVAGEPLVVDVADLPEWDTSDGSLVTLGPQDATALVRRDLSPTLPGPATAVTVRQQLLAEREFALRDRQDDPGSRADAVIVTAPGWDPGAAWRSADLAGLWAGGHLVPGLPDPVADATSGSTVAVPTAPASPPSDLEAVHRLQIVADRLAAISIDATATRSDTRLIADLVGTTWRTRHDSAVALADSRRLEIEADLALPSIEGPPGFLLAGREGQVPVTIDNPTDHAIRVGIRVTSTNPQLEVDDVAPVDVPAGSRTTVTIPIDVGQQNTTSLSAQLITPDGTPLGQSSQFNVRSSNTGVIIWVAMGAAAALLVVAVVRRLVRRARRPDDPDPGEQVTPAPDRGPAHPAAPVTPPPADDPPADRDDTARPPEPDAVVDRIAEASATDVARASAWMALGTMVSRVTGFLRALLLIWAIGTALNGDIFNSANTVPNALYMLVAGGVFNVVLVPQLVRAMRTHDDGGDAYANRVITLGLLVLGAATLILVLAAPLLVRLVFDSLLFTDDFAVQRESALWLMYLCVPQVFFYGAFVLVGQILNARGRFGPMMWAPIVNNVVACLALVGYMVMFGRRGGSDGFTVAEALVLGVGSTLGIVAQAATLIPYLRAAGFHYRPRFDFRGVGLGHTLRLGAWTLATIVVNQIAFIVVNRLGTEGNLVGAAEGTASSGAAVYNLGYIVSQVPHGVVTVSLATAIMPTLAALAHARDHRRFLSTVADTTRTALFLLVPLAVAVACLGPDLAQAISLGAASSSGDAIGRTLVALAPAIVVYSLMFLLVRAFYADEDTRVPFVIQTIVAVTNVAVAVTVTRQVTPADVAPALAVALSTAYLVGTVTALIWVRRRFGRLVDAAMVSFAARLGLASAAAGATMLGARELVTALGSDGATPLHALVRLTVAGLLGAGVFLLGAHLVRLTEAKRLMSIVTSR